MAAYVETVRLRENRSVTLAAFAIVSFGGGETVRRRRQLDGCDDRVKIRETSQHYTITTQAESQRARPLAQTENNTDHAGT